MKSTEIPSTGRVFALVVAGLCLVGFLMTAQGAQHLSIPQPGGMPGMPVMTGIEKTTNGVSVTWVGPSGYYQLFRKWGLTGGNWQPVGGPNLTREATITDVTSNAFFRVSGPAPQYVGSQACAECHQNVHSTEINTEHTQALEALKQVGQDTNPSCLPCHTVGYGLPSGFVSETATPLLEGVQCESCHGPAGNHAADENDFTVRPRVELAAQLCGGCHNAEYVPASAAASHPPYFEEWNMSPHRAVLPELQSDFASGSGPTFYIPTCGRCHSGTVREAFLEDDPLPDAQEASAVGIACATCHDPHANHEWTNFLSGVVTNQFDGIVITNNELGQVYTNQLSNPLASLQNYNAGGDFSTNYNEDINICGQCHNSRGAAWIDTSRAPHHSDQYNVLIGTVGVLGTNTVPYQPSTHALMEKQCAYCHMQTADHQNGPPEVAAVAGHRFVVTSYDACTQCHGSNTNAIGSFVTAVKKLITSGQNFSIQNVKAKLDLWATTAAPTAWQTKYGVRAWEYSTPGDLSPGGPGPTTAEQQALLQQEEAARMQDPNNPNLPDFRDIQKARFNLYLVLYDGSYGVHNGPYAIALLQTALDLVERQLPQ